MAVTVNEFGTPAVVAVGKPPTVNDAAEAGLTAIDCVPLGSTLKKSRTVSDCVPAVLSAALNVWLPASAAVNVQKLGRLAWLSLLEKTTLPKYWARLPNASNAVTTNVCDTPAVVVEGRPVIVNTDAGAGMTTMPDCVLE